MKIDKEKAMKSFIKYSIIIGIFLFITPYIVFIIGMAVMIIGAFSTSPTINLLRFSKKRVFKSAEVDVDELEDTDKIYNISWKESLLVFGIGVLLFIISLMLLSYGWRGIIFML
ncbi:hypothetical protein ABOONEI_2150 [Aciduliprofundum boonei T469]|nr:hypothetical protein ABOONEI_2150 [Aciduliprofundum boonei T469]